MNGMMLIFSVIVASLRNRGTVSSARTSDATRRNGLLSAVRAGSHKAEVLLDRINLRRDNPLEWRREIQSRDILLEKVVIV
jgi:hypothetical protein